MSAAYDDDRPGMMRVHIADRRADALCAAHTRDWLRANAKVRGISTSLNKREMAWYLAANHGFTAPGYDKAGES